MSFIVHRQLLPPSAVDFAVSAHFTARNDVNLILAKTNVLEVYRLREQYDENRHQAGSAVLDLIGVYPLFGVIESLAVLRRPGSEVDSLLLSFREAKVSVLEYDSSVHDVRLTSLHWFEEKADELLDGRFFVNSKPQLRVDPQQRCAVMVTYNDKLVVIPFRQDLSVLEADEHNNTGVPSSYIINLKDLGIQNIKDLVFLHGYYEPTLIILYEPIRTWAGRINARRDTCIVTVLTLYVSQRQHPMIWSVENLPYNSAKLVAVPEPLGGVLVFATNILLYLNQNSRLAVSLNDYAGVDCTSLTLQPSGANITLDNSQAVFVSPTELVATLKGGELYVVRLRAEGGGRAVAAVDFVSPGTTVLLASAVCPLPGGFLFVGSRVGESLLLRYRRHDDLDDRRPAKRQRFDEPANEYGNHEWEAEEEEEEDHMTEEALFGADRHHTAASEATARGPAYAFSVCDSLASHVGCVSDMAVGESAHDSGTRGHEAGDNDDSPFGGKLLDIVACSGFRKHGALTVVHRGVRGETLTAYELEGLAGVWTAQHHLLFNQADRTRVLATAGDELLQVDAGFDLEVPTIDAGEVGTPPLRCVVQVTPRSVRLVRNESVHQEIAVPSGATIVGSHIHDPHVMVMLSTGSALLLTADAATGRLSSASFDLLTKAKGPVASFCLFRAVLDPPTPHRAATADHGLTYDEWREAEEIYGSATPASTRGPKKRKQPDAAADGPVTAAKQSPLEARASAPFYCAVVRQQGQLELYRIPEFQLVFSTPSLARVPSLLTNHLLAGASTPGFREDTATRRAAGRAVDELGVYYLGAEAELPHLFVLLATGDLVVYQPFVYHDPSGPAPTGGAVPLRFAKFHHPHVTRPPSAAATTRPSVPAGRRIVPFDNIGGHSGVFVSGPRPVWVFYERRYPRVFAHTTQPAVLGFSPFHHASCPHGFVTTTPHGLVFQVLPHYVSLDGPLPTYKVKLGSATTPHRIAYHSRAKVYIAAVSEAVRKEAADVVAAANAAVAAATEALAAGQAEGALLSTVPAPPPLPGSRVPHHFEVSYTLRMLSPVTFEELDRFALDPFEHVLDVKILRLHSEIDERSKAGRGGRKLVIAVGTAYVRGGEDAASRGRILIFDVFATRTTEEADAPSVLRLKLLYAKEQKGPVTSLADLEGNLVAAIGPKLIAFSFATEKDLTGVGFFDAQLYTVAMASTKCFLLVADKYKSAYFLAWKSRNLHLLSKDYNHGLLTAASLCIDAPTLSLVVADRHRNVVVFQFAPQKLESMGGQKLLCRADFHLGSVIQRLIPLRMVQSGKTTTASLYACTDGAIGYFAPVEETVYRRLSSLQTKMVVNIQHTAGLNPKAFRAYNPGLSNLTRNRVHGVVDCELLVKFLTLSLPRQRDLTRAIGTTPEQVFDNLATIERAVASVL